MPSPSLLLGDVDSDGDVDVSDVIALSTFLTGGNNGEGLGMEAIDMKPGRRGRIQVRLGYGMRTLVWNMLDMPD